MVQYCQRLAFSVCVLVWGAVLLFFYQSAYLDAYIDAKFQLVLLIGGLGCMVVGLFTACTFRIESDCHHGEDCSHDHESSDIHPIIAVLVIIVPLLFSVVWTEHKIDDVQIAKQSAQDVDPASMRFLADLPPFTKETLDQTRQKTADGFYEMNLIELFYSAGDAELERVFTGLNFETVAMIREEPNRNPKGNRMRLYRLFMTCCAADMKTIPLSIEFESDLPQFEPNTWVKVGGEMYYEQVKGVTYPVLKIKRIEPTEAPEIHQRYK